MSGALHEEPSIRTAVNSDFEAVGSVINICFPRDRAVDKRTIDSWIASRHIHVAVVSEKVVGCVRLDPSLKGLFHLAVVPELQRQGIGSRLVHAAEQRARQLRWPEIFLGVDESEPERTDYYKKRGYQLMNELREMFAADGSSTGRNLIMMKKPLISPGPNPIGSHPHAAARKRKERHRKRES